MASLGQSKSVVSEFMKKKKADDGSSFEEAMLKLLRTLPKVLKYLPGLMRCPSCGDGVDSPPHSRRGALEAQRARHAT